MTKNMPTWKGSQVLKVILRTHCNLKPLLGHVLSKQGVAHTDVHRVGMSCRSVCQVKRPCEILFEIIARQEVAALKIGYVPSDSPLRKLSLHAIGRCNMVRLHGRRRKSLLAEKTSDTQDGTLQLAGDGFPVI